MRTFVAVPLARGIVREVTNCTSRLRSIDKRGEIRWVQAENLHLTLAFSGDIPSEQVPLICSALEKRVSTLDEFDLELQEIALFPPGKNPHVLAVIVRSSEALVALHQKTNQALKQCGIILEKRKFRPHITIGRLKQTRGKKPQIPPYPLFLKSPVDHISFFKSVLTPKGPHYTSLANISLQQSNALKKDR